MAKFNLSKLAGKSSASLLFTCDKCGNQRNGSLIVESCANCGSKIFKVSRSEIPIIENPQRDVYRSRGNEEDGPKMTTPGGEGGMGESGFGSNSRSDMQGNDEISSIRGDEIQSTVNDLPGDHDGLKDGIDQSMGDDLQSPAMTADGSPFNPINNKEPVHIGPFNMQKSMVNPIRQESVYERIRRRRNI